MKVYVFVIAVVLCNFAASFGQTPSANQTPVALVPSQKGDANERYRIGFQDTLEIQVFRHPELNRRVGVNPNGTIDLFRLDQPIVAVCKTETELAADIEKAYEKDYLKNPEVSVVAVDQKSQSVAVIGAVRTPGNFYISRKIQLLQLLAFAGGPDVEHAGTRLIVARPGSTSDCKMSAAQATATADLQLMDFKLRDVQEGKQTLWLQPGDVVSVLDADQIFVYGNVNKQGAVKIKEPLTLTRAIVLAEGFKSATKMDSIRVIRQKPGTTEHEEIIYNFKDISKGKAEDPVLEPNDIVAVSEDKTQNILNGIGRSLTGGIPGIFYRIP